MCMTIGGVALLVMILVFVFHWFRHSNDIYVDTQEEVDVIQAIEDPYFPHKVIVRDCAEDCPCRYGHPHHHLIDQHRDVLCKHPDSFVALHPIKGVAFATNDIVKFTTHMSSLDHNKRSALAVVHTSVL